MSGLIPNHSTIKKQYNLTVTGSGWTTWKAIGVPYKILNGTWRLTFNIIGSFDSATSSPNVYVSGVTWKNNASNNFYQAISSGTGTTAGCSAWCSPNESRVVATTTTSAAAWFYSGDVEIEGKPSWAD